MIADIAGQLNIWWDITATNHWLKCLLNSVGWCWMWPLFGHSGRITGRLIVFNDVFPLSSSLSMPRAWLQEHQEIGTHCLRTKAGVTTSYLPRRTCGLPGRRVHPCTAGTFFSGNGTFNPWPWTWPWCMCLSMAGPFRDPRGEDAGPGEECGSNGID